MFTLKTLLIVSILACIAYIVRSIPALLLTVSGMGAAAKLRKWTDSVGDNPGHIDANIRYGPGEQPQS
jgi:hypothetical protein